MEWCGFLPPHPPRSGGTLPKTGPKCIQTARASPIWAGLRPGSKSFRSSHVLAGGTRIHGAGRHRQILAGFELASCGRGRAGVRAASRAGVAAALGGGAVAPRAGAGGIAKFLRVRAASGRGDRRSGGLRGPAGIKAAGRDIQHGGIAKFGCRGPCGPRLNRLAPLG